jgi:hypothetical protein
MSVAAQQWRGRRRFAAKTATVFSFQAHRPLGCLIEAPDAGSPRGRIEASWI